MFVAVCGSHRSTADVQKHAVLAYLKFDIFACCAVESLKQDLAVWKARLCALEELPDFQDFHEVQEGLDGLDDCAHGIKDDWYAGIR